MSLDFPASVSCDKCGVRTSAKLVVDKLKPNVEMHLRLPAGWTVSSMPESGDLFTSCPKCPPVLVTIPPSELVPVSSDDDHAGPIATGPTLKPPPLPKI
jgi:hypothetical protein